MAINVLEEPRTGGPLLGLRVDDAVEARRARERRRGSLRAVPSAAPGRRIPATNRASSAVRQVRFEQAPVPCPQVRPLAKLDAPVEDLAPRSGGERQGLSALKSDPTFETAVEQAKEIATAVRTNNRSVRPEVSGSRAQENSFAYRLTVRGQRVLVALGFVVSIALGAAAGTVIGSEPVPEGTSTVVVQSGDSLWSIASVVAGQGEDPRPVLEQIAALNDLHSPLIASGQTLIVPGTSE